MATTTSRNLCDTCNKTKGNSRCEGCDKIFCYHHFADHRQQLNQEFDEIEVSRDVFRQTLNEQTADPQKHCLMQEINRWEHDAIQKIQKTAKEARKMLLLHTTGHFANIEAKLNELTTELKQSRADNGFVETDLSHWKEELNQLSEELAKPSNVVLREDSKPLVNKICIDVTIESSPRSSERLNSDTKWKHKAITVAGGNRRGAGLDQLYYPWGLYFDDDNQTLYVVDTNNHRVVKWKHNATSGEVLMNDSYNKTDAYQLSRPRDLIIDKKSNSLIISDTANRRVVRWPYQNGTGMQVIVSEISCHGLAMDNDGYLYVPDSNKNEIRRWKIGATNGTLVAGGNGRGNRLDQLNGAGYIFVDDEYSVYVSDEQNHRVVKWARGARGGVVVAGGNGEGVTSSQLSTPRGIIVDQAGTVYVADYMNDRVVRWRKGANQGTIIAGGDGRGAQSSQLSGPQDISFDRYGNLYVADLYNHRVQRFDIC